MEFPVWALKEVRKGRNATVVVHGWGTPLLPLEVKIIESWGGEVTYAAFFSAGSKFYEYRYSVKDEVCSDDHWDSFRMVECREVRRREKVIWEYEPVEPVRLPVQNLN